MKGENGVAARNIMRYADAPVEAIAVHGGPTLPYSEVLAKRSVAGARNIAEYAVEEELILAFCGDASLGG